MADKIDGYGLTSFYKYKHRLYEYKAWGSNFGDKLLQISQYQCQYLYQSMASYHFWHTEDILNWAEW